MVQLGTVGWADTHLEQGEEMGLQELFIGGAGGEPQTLLV